jgi:hypothetical protein
MENIIGALVTLAPHTRIAHHQPGRIRLKFLPSILQLANGREIETLVACIPGILEYRVNPLAKSIVINYDQQRLPYEVWVLLGQTHIRPELGSELAARLRSLWVVH